MMSNLSMVEATLPPGFRFHPRDEELICDYLFKKVSLSDSPLLVEVDLNKCEPWDLPETACVGGKEWYFYSQRDRKYATGLRTNRATVSGYWKATGKDRSVFGNRTLVGMRKTLVFYLGRAPKGKKTDWVMHEFRLQGPLAPPLDSSVKEDWVLCRVFCKNKETVGGTQISNNVNMGSIRSYGGHEDTVSSSSSLPPLMDPYTLSFDQSQPTTDTNIFTEQVPCFSIFNPPDMINTSNPQFDLINNNPHLVSITSSTNFGSATNTPPPNFGPSSTTYDQLVNRIPSSSSSSSHFYEKKEVIKAILSRFNKMDHQNNLKDPTTLSFGEGISDQSLLSDEQALPATMWYP